MRYKVDRYEEYRTQLELPVVWYNNRMLLMGDVYDCMIGEQSTLTCKMPDFTGERV